MVKLEKESPGRRRGHEVYDWHGIAEELRKSRGEWFRIAEMGYSSYVSRLRNGTVKAFATGQWEFEARKDGESWVIYGRYLGG